MNLRNHAPQVGCLLPTLDPNKGMADLFETLDVDGSGVISRSLDSERVDEMLSGLMWTQTAQCGMRGSYMFLP